MPEKENITPTIKVKKWDILRIITTLLDQNGRKYEEFARVDYIGDHGKGVEIYLSYERSGDVPVTGGITVEGEIVDDMASVPVVIEQNDWAAGRKSITTEVITRSEEIKKKKFGRDGLGTINRLHG